MATTSRRKKAALLALLGLLGLVGWWMAVQAAAWYHFRAGARALAEDDPAEARRHLEACVRVWSNSGEAHFLLARAARRTGELALAMRHLDLAADHGWVADLVLLERALLLVLTGDMGPEKYLHACLAANHPDSALILEVLTPHYLRSFQLTKAEGCIVRWLELQPERALAWNSKAVLAVRLRKTGDAIQAYREEVRLAPDRHQSRLELVKLLLERQQPDEAAAHLDLLVRARPSDPDVMVESARLRDRQGRRDEAARLLDAVLLRDPSNTDALHLRGRIALDTRRPEDAEPYLRRAVRLSPHSGDLLYSWLRCLQQVGKVEEAKEVQRRLKHNEAELERLSKLTASVVAQPNNPGLRREIAVVHFRNGLEEEGLRWLKSALGVAPDDPVTHRALADFYDRNRQPHLAAPHRARAGGVAAGKP